MPPFPEIEEGLSGKFAVLDRHRLDRDAGSAEEDLGLPHSFRAELVLDHHRQPDMVRHADAAASAS